MILDTSAIVAVVIRETTGPGLIEKLEAAERIGVGAPTAVEAGLVLAGRFRLDGHRIVEALMRDFDADWVPFGAEHWREAVSAFLRFGKGRHPARLDFGDCMSYATAKLAGMPLLFVGDDFTKTDIQAA